MEALELRILQGLLFALFVVLPICYGIAGAVGAAVGAFFVLVPFSVTLSDARSWREPIMRRFVVVIAITTGVLVGGVSMGIDVREFGFAIVMFAFGLVYTFARTTGWYYWMYEDLNEWEEKARLQLIKDMTAYMIKLYGLLGFVVGVAMVLITTPLVHLRNWIADEVSGQQLFRKINETIGQIGTLRSGIEHDIPFALSPPLYTSTSEALLLSLLTGLSMALACTIACVCSSIATPAARTSISDFSGSFPYLRAMFWPVVGYTLGFVFMAVWFAGLLASIYRFDQSSFSLPEDGALSFWEFLFFSVMTVTGLGYSGIVPESGISMVAVAVEALAGIAWIVVVFAAVIAYLEPRFRALQQPAENDARDRAAQQLLEAVDRLTQEVGALRRREDLERRRSRGILDRLFSRD